MHTHVKIGVSNGIKHNKTTTTIVLDRDFSNGIFAHLPGRTNIYSTKYNFADLAISNVMAIAGIKCAISINLAHLNN